MARPTIADVARTAGVSKSAVSFALNNRPGVAADTRDRILQAARDLGWTPSSKARALSVSRALAVGLVLARRPETLRADPFFPSFIAGIETGLAARGYSLLLHVAPDDARQDEVYRRLSSEGRVDGVFVTDLKVEDARPALLAELDLPAVIIGPALPEPFWPAVGVDDAPGIIAAVRHLVALGHTRIAHVSGPADMVHSRSRADAWAATLAESGLPQGPCVEADFSAESGVWATRELLESDEPPTAIVYANDLMAMAGLSWAVSRSIRVPEDLSITGYDDTEIAAHLQPSLTTVTTDVLSWGAAAATRLLELVDGADPSPIDLPPTRLVVRRSSGPVPHADTPSPAHPSPTRSGRRMENR
jgi:DNA-binding LacI/PurR family transcriptional regulator